MSYASLALAIGVIVVVVEWSAKIEKRRASWRRRWRSWRGVLLVVALGCFGCGPSAQNAAATAVAHATNAATVTLLETERFDAELAVAEAETAEDAREGVRRVRERWDPIWDAVHALRLAHDAYREGGPLAAVVEAYCSLRHLASQRGVALPGEVCRAGG